jgi:hypothetical protein
MMQRLPGGMIGDEAPEGLPVPYLSAELDQAVQASGN